MTLPFRSTERARACSAGPRILFVSYTADWTGPTHSLTLLLEHLDREFEPWVLLPGRGRFSDALKNRGVPFVSLPSLTKWRIPAMARLIRRHRFDLVYGNNTSGVCRNAMIAAKLVRVPFIGHVREMGVPGGWRQFGFLRFSDAVVAISEACARSVEHYVDPERLYVVHNAVDPADFDRGPETEAAGLPDLPADAFLITSVAHILPRKCQHLAVEAMSRLVRDFPESHLLLVGASDRDPSYTRRVRDTIARLGLERHVHLTGFREDVPKLLGLSEALLHTARTEPFGRAVIEAMAAGLPVVAFDVDGVGETVLDGSTGILCRSDDVACLASALRRLREDAELRRALGARGRERVEQHFTASSAARHVQEILQRTMAGRPRSNSTEADGNEGPHLDDSSEGRLKRAVADPSDLVRL